MADGPAKIVVYDGYCHLCAHGMGWLFARVPAGRIRFVPAQSDEGAARLMAARLDPADPETILVIAGARVLVTSDAVRHLLTMTGPAGAAIGAMLGIVPRRWRDRIYRAVARRRYRWFGRADTCFVPGD